MTLPNLKDLKFLEQIQVQRCLNIFESNLNVKKTEFKSESKPNLLTTNPNKLGLLHPYLVFNVHTTIILILLVLEIFIHFVSILEPHDNFEK